MTPSYPRLVPSWALGDLQRHLAVLEGWLRKQAPVLRRISSGVEEEGDVLYARAFVTFDGMGSYHLPGGWLSLMTKGGFYFTATFEVPFLGQTVKSGSRGPFDEVSYASPEDALDAVLANFYREAEAMRGALATLNARRGA